MQPERRMHHVRPGAGYPEIADVVVGIAVVGPVAGGGECLQEQVSDTSHDPEGGAAGDGRPPLTAR